MGGMQSASFLYDFFNGVIERFVKSKSLPADLAPSWHSDARLQGGCYHSLPLMRLR